jgi:hypothetical protein
VQQAGVAEVLALNQSRDFYRLRRLFVSARTGVARPDEFRKRNLPGREEMADTGRRQAVAA